MNNFLENVYNDYIIFKNLNKIEVEYIFKYAMLLKDEKIFFTNYFKEVPDIIDTRTKVFEKADKTKYHLTNNCRFLHKDYLDFGIPSGIKDKDIGEFRNWFRHCGFAERYKSGQIDKAYINRQFNLKYTKEPYKIDALPENSGLLVYEIKNSDTILLKETFEQKQFEKELEEAKKQLQNMFQCGISRKISKFKHLLNKEDSEIKEEIDKVFVSGFTDNYGIDNLKHKFKFAEKHVNKISALLIDYICWNYNASDKSFDIATLESFNLECCYSCKNNNTNKQ